MKAINGEIWWRKAFYTLGSEPQQPQQPQQLQLEARVGQKHAHDDEWEGGPTARREPPLHAQWAVAPQSMGR